MQFVGKFGYCVAKIYLNPKLSHKNCTSLVALMSGLQCIVWTVPNTRNVASCGLVDIYLASHGILHITVPNSCSPDHTVVPFTHDPFTQRSELCNIIEWKVVLVHFRWNGLTSYWTSSAFLLHILCWEDLDSYCYFGYRALMTTMSIIKDYHTFPS